MAIKISSEELAKLGEPSIPMADGSGYLAETAVFHELHCIVRTSKSTGFIFKDAELTKKKRIRRHLHLDHYYGNQTSDPDFMDRERRHMGECE